MWDLRHGCDPCKATLSGHAAHVSCVAVTPDGLHAVSGSHDAGLRVWDLGTGTCTATLKGHGSPVLGLAITPDGRRAVSISTRGLLVWDLGTCRFTTSLPSMGYEYGYACVSMCVLPGGRHVVYCGGSSGVVRVASLPDRVGS